MGKISEKINSNNMDGKKLFYILSLLSVIYWGYTLMFGEVTRTGFEFVLFILTSMFSIAVISYVSVITILYVFVIYWNKPFKEMSIKEFINTFEAY